MSNLSEQKPQSISSGSQNLPRRKRRFKIFGSVDNSDRNKQESSIAASYDDIQMPKVQSQIYGKKPKNAQFVKLPKKQFLQASFVPQQQTQTFPQPTLSLQGINTVGSQKFGITRQFQLKKIQQPFAFIRGHSHLINQESNLFKSVSQLKQSFKMVNYSSDLLVASVRQLEHTVVSKQQEKENYGHQLRNIQKELTLIKEEGEKYKHILEDLDTRLDAIELRQSARQGKLGHTQKQQQLRMFIHQKGLKPQYQQEQQDQFVQTQFLPAHLIAQFLQLRKKKTQQKKQITHNLQLQQELNKFHPCLNITQNKYNKLQQYIKQQFQQINNKKLCLQLLFRMGTVNLDRQFYGGKECLEYKENLLFVLRSSFGNVLGGFISNYYIEKEIRDDQHAFLFSLEQGCIKFKVKEEHQVQAYEVSNHYLICFGSDLMISSDCLQQQSYCEWPNIYKGDDRSRSMSELAQQFSFMIQHIEIYQVTFQ